jgi:hypothetical protein
MGHKQIGDELDWIHLATNRDVKVSYEHGNELSDSMTKKISVRFSTGNSLHEAV